MLSKTPSPPYYAVIFSSVRTNNTNGYDEMGSEMQELARQQKGFLGFDSARDEVGISVSYWTDLESIQQWKSNAKHMLAQKLGKEKWYENYITRIAKVEHEYTFDK